MILFQLTKENIFYDKSVSEVLNNNIKESHSMYNDKKFSLKLEMLINLINKEIKKDKKNAYCNLTSVN